jgi:hypothetical protein
MKSPSSSSDTPANRLYGGFPRITRIGFSRLTLLARSASFCKSGNSDSDAFAPFGGSQPVRAFVRYTSHRSALLSLVPSDRSKMPSCKWATTYGAARISNPNTREQRAFFTPAAAI